MTTSENPSRQTRHEPDAANETKVERDQFSAVWDRIEQLEMQAAEFHAREANEVERFWRQVLDYLLQAITPLHRQPIPSDESLVLMALVVRALNSNHCSFDLALRGHHLQALNLMRMPREDVVAFWYLRFFPSQYTRFLEHRRAPPARDAMLREMRSKHAQLHIAEKGETEARRAAKEYVDRLDRYVGKLDVFSHVDKPGMTGVIFPGSGEITYALGPQRNMRAFTFCASWALEGLLPLVNVVDNLRQLHGFEALGDAQQWVQRIAEWQQRIGDEFAETELETDHASTRPPSASE